MAFVFGEKQESCGVFSCFLMSLKAERCFGLCPFSQYIQILKTFQVYIQFVSHALYLKHSSVYSWKWEEFAKIIVANFFFFSDSIKQCGLSMTPDFLSPSPTQLDYKYFSSSDENSTKICSCLWCTSCTSPVLLTAGLCQYSPWTGLHTAEVYPCCPSNKSTQPAPQEQSPEQQWQIADSCSSLRQNSTRAPFQGNGSVLAAEAAGHSLGPLRNLHAHLFPKILVLNITNYPLARLTFLVLSSAPLSLCHDLFPLLGS